jgi:site-specific DNA-cytosine methylase
LKHELRALGITCGIGSMLIGSRDIGFKVIGNIEFRKYYHTGTFEHNFTGAFMVHEIGDLSKKQIQDLEGIDLIMSHTECGPFSLLNSMNKKVVHTLETNDTPLLIKILERLRPRFFAMDNLPQSFLSVDMKYWADHLPMYDLFPEWISNYHYGNTQKNRRRFFMIGALRSEKFVFIPGELEHTRMSKDVLKGLGCKDIPAINHVHKPGHMLTNIPSRNHIKNPEATNLTVAQVKEVFSDYPSHRCFPYTNRAGETKLKAGFHKIDKTRHSPVLSGGGLQGADNHYWSDTMEPLTIRERARIQGCPDDFIFLPISDSLSNKNRNLLIKQTGKFMPVQFCEFLSRQIYNHIKKIPMGISGRRFIKPNPLIDEAKKWYCDNVGYGKSQSTICAVCWLPCSDGGRK